MEHSHAHEPGGFWRRLGADIIDSLIFWPVYILLTLLFDFEDRTEENIAAVLQLLYFLIVPAIWFGYTVGKRAVGVRIVRLDGKKVSVFTMFMRYVVGGLVYGITFGIAFIASVFMVIFRKDKRAVHDFIAGTRVVRDDK